MELYGSNQSDGEKEKEKKMASTQWLPTLL